MLAERITTSFAAWETRGRGWTVAPYPVELEPPFRPFFLLPAPEEPLHPIDDGVRPTFLSALSESVTAFFAGKRIPETELPTFEEDAPFPAYERPDLVSRRILVPRDFVAQSEVMLRLLQNITAALYPVSFELIGTDGAVTIQITCCESDALLVFSSVTNYAPDATLLDEPDFLQTAWTSAGSSLVVDLGYADEFFLPFAKIQPSRIDPYIPLVSALGRAGSGEALCFQVLFQRTMNPWRAAILESVTTQDGKALFVDAPEYVPAAREKTSTPLVACVVRMAGCADTPERAVDLVRGSHAFIAQFGRPGGNRLLPLSNDEYPDALHERAFLERTSFRTGMILSLDELLGLVHLPDASVQHEAFVRAEKNTKALPAIAKGHALVIGENVHRGIRTSASLSASERLAHTIIVGSSGTGKSTLLVNMIRQDMEHGDGCAVLDPHGDLIADVLRAVPKHRRDDVILFDPSDKEWPVGFNILDAESELEKNLLASDVASIFQRLSTSWGDGMSTVLSNAVLAILESKDGGTLLHLRRFLVDEVYRKSFLKAVEDQDVQFFWAKEWPLIGSRSIGPILTRLNTFLRPKLIRHIVGQQQPKLRMGSVLAERKILLVKLAQGQIGNENAYLLGSLLLSKLLQATFARQRIPQHERKPFWLYLDEAEHFVTPSVASLLTEARKYGVGLNLAFQMLSQLRDVPRIEQAALGARTRIVFRVADEDVRKLSEGFASFEAPDIRGLGCGETLVRIGEATNDFTMRTLGPTRNEADDPSETIQERSRAQYGMPAAALRRELDAFWRPETSDVEEPKNSEEPRRPIPMPAPPDVPPPKSAHSKPTTPSTSRAEPPPPAPLGRGGSEHKYLQHLIKRLAEERGFRAVIEEQVAGGQVDVALRRDGIAIACEVSITTSTDHELDNAKKCAAAGFTEVWLVVSDRKRQSKLLAAGAALSEKTSLRYLTPDDLVAAIDRFAPSTPTTEKVVGGYKVKVRHRPAKTSEHQQRMSIVGRIVAQSFLEQRKGKNNAN